MTLPPFARVVAALALTIPVLVCPGPGGGQIEYLGAIGIRRNLIVELVSQVAPLPAEDDPESSDRRAVEARRRAALARLKRMYDGLALAVCSG